MARELEAKFRVDSHEAVRAALAAAGAERVGRVTEVNHIFDRPDGELRRRGAALRVRGFRVESGAAKAARMTYKGPVEPSRFKSREEIEIDVGDADAAVALLEAAGFAVAVRFEKRRETWRSGACLVELDELPLLGCFVEIEGPSEAAIAAVQERIGLGGERHVEEGYVAMLARYCAETGVDPRGVAFGGG